MPITIDLSDHALVKMGEELGIERKTRIGTINMIEKDIPIKDIAEIQEVSIDYVIQIKNELHEKETKRTTIINQLKEGISVENIAESQVITIDEVIAIKNELDQKEG